jgi:arabinan endo-1,5-alpha-L-arabinosidase
MGLVAGLTVGLPGSAQAPGSDTGRPAPAPQLPGAASGNAPAAAQGRPPMAAVGVPVLGMPFVHDPSTVVRFHGRYYVFSTGRGAPFYSSPDGETWTREGSVFQQIPDDVHSAVPKNNGTDVWAPDIIRVNGQFYLYYAVSSWGSFQSALGLATNPVLDPKDPAYKWTDRGVVVSSNGAEDLNAIDPGVIHAPDGTLWLCYGSYHGSIRITQLDPKTGLALKPDELGAPVATARESEASDIIFHDGYYYLFVNHGSCCKGRNSEYNIRVGRARTIAGPYLDKHGDALAKGGGSLFLAAHDHRIGPGHFGRLLDYDSTGRDPTSRNSNEADGGPDGADAGPERFSVHYEADLTRNGRSVLDIRPLLWSSDGWPVAGDNLADGTYQIVSSESENNLQSQSPTPSTVPFRNVDAGSDPAAAASASLGKSQNPPANPPAVSKYAPPRLHLGRYLTLENQKWTISAAGSGFYKIVNVGSGDAIEAAAGGDKADIDLAAYTGADGQLWRLEQFPDGSYRIVNKATGFTLTATGANGVAASEFVQDGLHLWKITSP